MNTLPVSRKVYADISGRINSALACSPASAAEAMRLVDSYLAENDTDSDDAAATLAFQMIKAELDRAVIRSRRARQLALSRKKNADTAKISKIMDKHADEIAALLQNFTAENPADDEEAPKIMPSRSQRRKEKRRPKNRWKPICSRR